jgi:hypothetical protein
MNHTDSDSIAHCDLLVELHAQGGGFLDGISGAKQTLASITSTLAAIEDMMTRMKKAVQFEEDDDTLKCLLSRLEGLLLLIVQLSRANNLVDMVLPVLAYIKSWAGSTSLTETVCKWAEQILTEDSDGNSLSDETTYYPSQDGDLEGSTGWFSTNWTKFTQGSFGRRVASLINLLIITGLAPETVSGKMTVELYKVVHVAAERKKNPSVFHHLFTTLDWLVDSVIPAITTGNMALLLSDEDTEEVDKLYRSSLDAARLATTGLMKTCTEKYGITTEADLLVYLTKTTMALLTLKKRVFDDPMMVREVNQRLIMIDKVTADLQASWHEAGLRVKPYAVYIYGGSSLGKSVIANIVCHAISRRNKFPQGKEYMCTINGSDQYQSDYNSKHICVIFDDMGNTRPEKCEGNPLFVLIQFINNMHCSALSPEAEKKGKMDIRSKIVVVTSNTADLHSSMFSVNPASIMRRFDCFVECKLRADATGPDGGLHSKFSGNSMPDAWLLDFGTISIKRNMSEKHHDTPVTNYVTKEGSIMDLVDYLDEVTPVFFAKQEAIVASSTDMHLKPHCVTHTSFTLPCPKCALLDKEVPAEFVPVDVTKPLEPSTGLWKSFTKADPLNAKIRDNPLFEDIMTDFSTSSYKTIPTVEECKRNFEHYPCSAEGDGLAHEYIPSCHERLRQLLAKPISHWAVSLRQARHNFNASPTLKAMSIIAGIGLSGYAMYHLLTEKPLEEEGAMIAKIQAAARSPRQIVDRDDAYRRVYSNTAVYPEASKSSTLAQLEAKIDRNLHLVLINEFNDKDNTTTGLTQWCNAFPIGGTEWLITGHQFEKDKTYQVEFSTHPEIGIKRFRALVNESNMRPIFGCDAVVLDLPSGGDVTNFTKYMPETADSCEIKAGDSVFVYHVHKCIMNMPTNEYVPPSAYKETGKITKVGPISVANIGTYDGFEYEVENHKGMCGSMIFTTGRNPVLIGLHSAGAPGTKRAGAVRLFQPRVTETKPVDHVLVSESAPRREVIYNKDVTTNPEVHTFNPVHYLSPDKDFNMEIFGQHKLPLSRFTTSVKKSIIQDKLVEQGMEVKDTPPPKSAVRPTRHRHLENGAEILPPVNPRYLKLAKNDFIHKLNEVVLRPESDFTTFVHPLSPDDALNGVVEVKGIEPVNPDTSMSFPLVGPKWKYFKQCDALKEQFGLNTKRFVRKEVDPITGDATFHYEIQFDPEKADVIAETEHNLTLFHKAERANITFRTHCKDAAISFEKAAAGKIRIVAGAPVDMVVTSRMLTLTLINAMTYFPAEFESAVGVNAAGKDWEYIADVLSSKSGGQRCGDGDYSAYDQKIRPEFSKAAFEILKYLLAQSGFPPDLLKIFDGFATECIYPIYDIDGLIVKLFGTGPSGHPLTVIINGLVNSLYMRYAYYSMHAADLPSGQIMTLGLIPLFHEMVALMTYGDDNGFDTSPEETMFNMISVAEELAKIGVKYTGADKKVSTKPFKTLDEMSFLKRSFLVHPELKVRVGALDLDSINRSLLMSRGVPKGCPNSEAEITAQNMMGALGEAYLHGEEVYYRYRTMFQSLLDVRDSESYAIKDYYYPPTVEELRDRYFNTTCCYLAAQATLKGQAELVPLEGSAGWIYDDNGVLEHFELTGDDETDYYQLFDYWCHHSGNQRFLGVHYDYFGESHEYPCEFGNHSDMRHIDVEFRRWAQKTFPGSITSWFHDYRLIGSFALADALAQRIWEMEPNKEDPTILGRHNFDVELSNWCYYPAQRFTVYNAWDEPPTSWPDIRFRSGQRGRWGGAELLSNDYRAQRDHDGRMFNDLLYAEYYDLIMERKEQRVSLCAELDYIHSTVDEASVALTIHNQPPAPMIYRRMRRREVGLERLLPLPPEIIPLIWDFLHPSFLSTDQEVDEAYVAVTPNFYPAWERDLEIRSHIAILTGVVAWGKVFPMYHYRSEFFGDVD